DVEESIDVQLGNQVAVQKGQLVKVEGTDISVLLPNDLPEGTEILISENNDATADNLKAAGDIVDVDIILPEGAENPEGDYELTLSVDADMVDEDAAIYYFNETTGEWESKGGTV